MGRKARPGKRYGPAHVAVRTRLMRSYVPGVTKCWRCGQPMTYPRGSRLIHLGHLDSGRGYGGLEHHNCNEAAGGVQSGIVRRGGWDRRKTCGHCGGQYEAETKDQEVCSPCRRLTAKGVLPAARSGRAW